MPLRDMVCSFAFKSCFNLPKLIFSLNSLVSRERPGKSGGKKSIITLLIVFTNMFGTKFPPRFVNLIAVPLYQGILAVLLLCFWRVNIGAGFHRVDLLSPFCIRQNVVRCQCGTPALVQRLPGRTGCVGVLSQLHVRF